MRDASGVLRVEIGGRTFDSSFSSQNGMDMIVEVEAIALITFTRGYTNSITLPKRRMATHEVHSRHCVAG